MAHSADCPLPGVRGDLLKGLRAWRQQDSQRICGHRPWWEIKQQEHPKSITLFGIWGKTEGDIKFR